MIDPNLLMLSVGCGLVVALVLAEGCGLSTGGLVVPGYLALFLPHLPSVLATLLVASLSYAAVSALSRWVLVFGRRRTVLTVLVAFLLSGAAEAVYPSASLTFGSVRVQAQASGFVTIGHIVPGLIAVWFDRDGVGPGLAGIAIGSSLTRLILIALLGDLLPGTGWLRAGAGL